MISLNLGNPEPKAAEPGSGNPLDDRFYGLDLAGYRSLAGVNVTAEGALRIAAVYRAVSILANLLAWLPKGVFETVDEGRRAVPEHPLNHVISVRPNERQNAFEFWRLMMTWLLLRPAAFAQIVVSGTDLQLVPLHPDRMSDPQVLPSGAIRYWFMPRQGPRVPLIEGQDVWVLKSLSDDGIRGLSKLNLARDSFGTSMAAQQHAASYYQNGVNLAGVLQHPARLKPETAKAMSENFGQYYGGRGGLGTVPVLWEGMEFKALSMTNKDAEFIESLKFFSVGEVARWFGIPNHLLHDVEKSTSWGTGIEEQRSDMTTYTVIPWCALIEGGLRKDLLLQPERYYVRVNVNALLRGKTYERYQVYEIGIRSGILSPNDARRSEDLPPRDGGDVYVTPTAPQQSAGRGPGAGPAPEPPEEPESEDQKPAKGSAAARWAVAHALRCEREALAAAATKHASDPGRWRRAVDGVYGNQVAFLQSIGVPENEARAYCEEARRLAQERGAAALETWETERAPALMRLVLGEVA